MSKGKGLFITVEGCDGSGKTTAMSTLSKVLRKHHLPHTQTREPGGTGMAEDIRNVLLTPREEAPGPIAELLLINAARWHHIEYNIKPAIENGIHVISDRFTDSTFAYQGAGGVDVRDLEWMENLVQGSFRPNFTILLDIDPVVARRRLEDRGEKTDHFEGKGLTFQENCRKLFLERAKRNQSSTIYYIIPAGHKEEIVNKLLETAVKEMLYYHAMPDKLLARLNNNSSKFICLDAEITSRSDKQTPTHVPQDTQENKK